MHVPTPPADTRLLVHRKDRSLVSILGVDVLVVEDEFSVDSIANSILSPRHLCRSLLDVEPSTSGSSVLISDAFSESVYELYTKTCTTMGAEYLNYTGATPKFLLQTTWWPIARVDSSQRLLGGSSRVWPSTSVESCVAWLTDSSVDPISGLKIEEGSSAELNLLRERLRVWARLDPQVLVGENRRELLEVVRLCGRVLGLPTLELGYRLERHRLEALVSHH